MKKLLLIASLLAVLAGTVPSSSQIQVGAGGGAGGGGTPGGANTNVQFNNSSAFGGDAGFTYAGTGQVGIVNSTVNTTPLTISGGSITGSSAVVSGVSVTGTLNTTGTLHGYGIFTNFTNTASNNSSTMLEMQIGGTSQFNVDRFGMIRVANATYGAGNVLLSQQGMTTSANQLTFGSGNGTGDFAVASGTCTCIEALNSLSIGITTSTTANIPDTLLSRGGAAATWQLGAPAAAAPVNQTLQAQGSRPGTDTNVAGGNLLIQPGRGTGNSTSSSLNFDTWVAVASGSATQTQTGTMTLTAGLVSLPNIGSDATHTDASICEDTTTHALYSGSGTLGVCLGTSSARYKHDIADLDAGLLEIMALQPKSYHVNADHGDPSKTLYGFLAEDGASVVPDLVGFDTEGRPNTFDYLGIVPVLVKAMQQQQREIEVLKAELATRYAHK
jgi:hypothetical protein